MITQGSFKGAPCPSCGNNNDAFTGVDATPQSGDYGICSTCGAVNVFTDDVGTVRSATVTEIQKLEEYTPNRFGIGNLSGCEGERI